MNTGLQINRKLEYIFWFVTAVCLVYWIFIKTQTALAQAQGVERIDSLIVEAALDNSQWSKHRVEEHRAVKASLDDAEALAILEIQGIDLRVAVFNGTSDDILNIGVGRIPGTAQIGGIGNLGLAGHRDGFFRPLKDISIGDIVVIRHLTGVERYEVSELLIVKPENVSVLNPSSTNKLTLVTCYPFYFVGNAPERFIVVADKITS